MARQKMSAEQKQKISESVKRARLAKGAANASVEPSSNGPLADARFTAGRYGGGFSAADSTSKATAMQLAIDLVDMLSDEVPPRALVQMIERILRQ